MLRRISIHLIFLFTVSSFFCAFAKTDIAIITNQEANIVDIIDLKKRKKVSEVQVGEKPAGIFIDKLSGVPLFDTKDRFNSNTGWLSFTAPITGSVYTKPDNSYGMRRTEIRSVTSDIHLGHVFNDGPNGMPRYCINATVLEFKPRNERR